MADMLSRAPFEEDEGSSSDLDDNSVGALDNSAGRLGYSGDERNYSAGVRVSRARKQRGPTGEGMGLGDGEGDPRGESSRVESEAEESAFRAEAYERELRVVGEVLERVRRGGTLQGLTARQRRKACDYFLRDGYLWKRPSTGGGIVPLRIIGTQEERKTVLRGTHDAVAAGHRGVVKTYERTKEKYFWPGMFRDVEKFVQTWHLDVVYMPRVGKFRYLVLARESLTNFLKGRH